MKWNLWDLRLFSLLYNQGNLLLSLWCKHSAKTEEWPNQNWNQNITTNADHRNVHLASLIPNSSNAKPADLDTRGYSQAIREQSVLADAIGFYFARDSWDNSTEIGENTLYEGPFTLREEDPSTRKNLEGRATFR